MGYWATLGIDRPGLRTAFALIRVVLIRPCSHAATPSIRPFRPATAMHAPFSSMLSTKLKLNSASARPSLIPTPSHPNPTTDISPLDHVTAFHHLYQTYSTDLPVFSSLLSSPPLHSPIPCRLPPPVATRASLPPLLPLSNALRFLATPPAGLFVRPSASQHCIY